MLPDCGLGPTTVAEVKPAAHGDWPAALALAASLASGRHRHLASRGSGAGSRPVLCCLPPGFTAEHGRLQARALAGFGLPCEALLVVEARRDPDVLWALEEGLRSQALSVAVGIVRAVDLTPSRRLALAAAAARTPVLLLTHPATPPAPAAALRLRIRRLASGPHPYDPAAPGALRLGLAVERCRNPRSAPASRSLELEWCDETHCFRVVASLAGGALETPFARKRAFG
jgi:protein ImuA